MPELKGLFRLDRIADDHPIGNIGPFAGDRESEKQDEISDGENTKEEVSGHRGRAARIHAGDRDENGENEQEDHLTEVAPETGPPILPAVIFVEPKPDRQ